MEQILSVLYLGNAVVTVVAYLPQILKLRRIKTKPKNFSVTSWFLWTYVSVVTLLYATFIIKDIELMIVTSLSFTLCALVFVIVIYKNLKY